MTVLTRVLLVVSAVLSIFLGLSLSGTIGPGSSSPTPIASGSGHGLSGVTAHSFGTSPTKTVRPSGPVFTVTARTSDGGGNSVVLHSCGAGYRTVDLPIGTTANTDGSLLSATQSSDGYAQTDVHVVVKAGPHLLIAGMIVRAVSGIDDDTYLGTESDTPLSMNIRPGGSGQFDLQTTGFTQVYTDLIPRVTFCVTGLPTLPSGQVFAAHNSTDGGGNSVVMHTCGPNFQTIDLPIGQTINRNGSTFTAKQVSDGYAQTDVNVSVTAGPSQTVAGMIVHAVSGTDDDTYLGAESDSILGMNIQPGGHASYDLITAGYTQVYTDLIPRVAFCLAA